MKETERKKRETERMNELFAVKGTIQQFEERKSEEPAS